MKYLVFAGLIVLFFAGFGLYQYLTLQDGKFSVTVCDVGQGDAVHLRTPQGYDILFDGGPDKSVLDCLSRSMPFWDRSIDLMILSHPHADHLNGLVYVLERYRVGRFVTEDLANKTEGFGILKEAVGKEALDWQIVEAGDVIRTPDGVRLRVLSPDGSFLRRTAATGFIDSGEFASLIVLASYGEFDVLLTGDTQAGQLEDALRLRSGQAFADIEVLQVPHHGSRTGLTREILEKLRPETATISVGENKYGHPTKFILELLKQEGIETRRTDFEADITIKTDGTSYNVK